MDCPPSLLGVRTYFLRAEELKLSRPYVAHRIRLFAVELAMKVPLPSWCPAASLSWPQSALVLQHASRLPERTILPAEVFCAPRSPGEGP
jgi:hypothetical protein